MARRNETDSQFPIYMHNTYSVFVGHLTQETQRRELIELFSQCGQVVEAVVLCKGSLYNHGFVRFGNLESAIRAVKELHKSVFKGSRIVVDLTRDTVEKVVRDPNSAACVGDMLMSGPNQSPSKVSENCQNRSPDVKSIEHVQQSKYNERLREICNAKISDDLLKDDIMTDISKAFASRSGMVDGKLPEEASIECVKNKIKNSFPSDQANTKIQDLMTALSDVMLGVNSYLKEKNAAASVKKCQNMCVDQLYAGFDRLCASQEQDECLGNTQSIESHTSQHLNQPPEPLRINKTIASYPEKIDVEKVQKFPMPVKQCDVGDLYCKKFDRSCALHTQFESGNKKFHESSELNMVCGNVVKADKPCVSYIPFYARNKNIDGTHDSAQNTRVEDIKEESGEGQKNIPTVKISSLRRSKTSASSPFIAEQDFFFRVVGRGRVIDP